MGGITAVTTALLAVHAVRASAQISTVCPSTAVCYGLNIPENTASTGSGDIFFQISGPSSLSWIALGQGGSMDGSNMFVVYASGDGNVTLSPRLGQGHSHPEYNPRAEVTLLEGSGVSNGKMVANVKCSNCNSWHRGDMDFSSSSERWIHARKSGAPMDTTDPNAAISKHGNDYGIFRWNFDDAKGGNSVNPFSKSRSDLTSTQICKTRTRSTTAATGSAVKSTANPTGAQGTSWSGYWSGQPTARPTAAQWSGHSPRDRRLPDFSSTALDTRDDSDDEIYCEDDGNGDGNGNGNSAGLGGSNQPQGNGNSYQVIRADIQKTRRMIIAHGVLACLAFVILFPFGAISIRLLSFPGLVWFHAAVQIFAYCVYIAAFGLGVYLVKKFDPHRWYHPAVGIVVFILLFFQPILGFLHHHFFTRYRSRTLWSHLHLWLGRVIITLGIINGGLGLMYADNTTGGKVIYAIVAGIVWVLYVAAAVFGEVKRKRRLKHPEPPMYSDNIPVSTPAGG